MNEQTDVGTQDRVSSPRELKQIKKELHKEIESVLDQYDLALSKCGSKKGTLESCPPLNEETGFWNNPNGATNKPLRWILHLEVVNGQVKARVPDLHGSKRIAVANTAQGTSGAVTTRIIPALKVSENRFIFLEEWEWLLLFCFFPALQRGSSAQLFERFDVKTGKLTYMGKEQDYIMACLVPLQDKKDSFPIPGTSRVIRYEEATQAVADLIHVTPVESDELSERTQNGVTMKSGQSSPRRSESTRKSWEDEKIRTMRRNRIQVEVASPGSDEFVHFSSTNKAYQALGIQRRDHRSTRAKIREGDEVVIDGYRFRKYKEKE